MSDNDLIRRGDAMRIMSDGDDIVRPDYPEWFINRYATINAIPAVQPTVKPLVWVEPKADGVFAERIWASEIYTIEKRNHAEVFDLYCSLWDGDNSVRFDTLEAAKAAAQADYEARILSALDMLPTVKPDVVALVEALEFYAAWDNWMQDERGVSLVDQDEGKTARATLARVKGETK